MPIGSEIDGRSQPGIGATTSGRRMRLVLIAYAIALLSLAIVIGSVWVPSHQGRDYRDERRRIQAPPAEPSLRLPAPDLLRPLAPADALEQNRSRPFANLEDSPAHQFKIQADKVSQLRAIECLTQAIYYEAASESVDGGRAVAQVVLNRLRHPAYPNSVCAVIYQGWQRSTGCQFSFTCDGSLARIPVPRLWAQSRTIAQEALAGRVFAPVGHATHYHADYVLPYWADSLLKMKQIGHHIFYRLPKALGAPAAFSQRYAGGEILPPSYTGKAVIEEALANVDLGSDPIQDSMAEGLAAVEARPDHQPTAALLADLTAGTLLADTGDDRSRRSKKSATEPCPAGDAGNQIAPIRANDVRSIKDGKPC